MIEIILLTLIFVFLVTYRSNTGENFSKFFISSAGRVYEKYGRISSLSLFQIWQFCQNFQRY